MNILHVSRCCMEKKKSLCSSQKKTGRNCAIIRFLMNFNILYMYYVGFQYSSLKQRLLLHIMTFHLLRMTAVAIRFMIYQVYRCIA